MSEECLMAIFQKTGLILNSIADFATSRSFENWTKIDAYLKGNEEFGEISKAILIINNKMPHKKLNYQRTYWIMS